VGKEKDSDFLIWSTADIYGPMNAVAWLVPINLSRCDFDVLTRMSVTKFDGKNSALENDRYAMERIPVPPRGFTRRENQSSYYSRSSVMKCFLDHLFRPEQLFSYKGPHPEKELKPMARICRLSDHANWLRWCSGSCNMPQGDQLS
jgi:hypothetical protein